MRWSTVLLFAVLLIPGTVIADPEAAKFFAERGRQALSEKSFEKAEEQFRKSLSEEAGYLPAILGLAETAYAKGDNDKAIVHLEACLDRERGGVKSPEDAGIFKRASALLKELDRPRLEYREIIENYVDKLMKLCKSSMKESPELARQCLERVLQLCPEYPGAARLAEKLGASPGGTGQTAREGEKLLFNGKDLDGWTGKPPGWTVNGGVVVALAPKMARYMRMNETIEGDYIVEFEMRVIEDIGIEPIIDMCYGFLGTWERWTVTVSNDQLSIVQFMGTKAEKKRRYFSLYHQRKNKFDRFQWHTYRIEAKAGMVSLFLDGELEGKREAAPGSLNGTIGVVVQDVRAEFRRIALLK